MSQPNANRPQLRLIHGDGEFRLDGHIAALLRRSEIHPVSTRHEGLGDFVLSLIVEAMEKERHDVERTLSTENR